MKYLTKEIGKLLEQPIEITNFSQDNVVKVSCGKLEIVICKNNDGEVTVTVDNYQDHVTLVTSLGKENDYRWY